MSHLENFKCCNLSEVREVNKKGKWQVYCLNCQKSSTQEEYRANAHMIWIKIVCDIKK